MRAILLIVAIGAALVSSELIVNNSSEPIPDKLPVYKLSSCNDYPLVPSATNASVFLSAPGVISTTKAQSLNGSVVFLYDWSGQYLGQILMDVAAKGAVAALLGTSFAEPGRGIWTWRENQRRYYVPADFKMPVFSMSFSGDHASLWDYAIADKAFNVTILMKDLEVNSFRDATTDPATIGWQLAMVLPSVASLIYCCVIFGQLVYLQRVEANIGMAILWLEIAGNLLRIIYCAWNPLGIRSLWPEFWVLFIITTSIPLGCISDLLLLFYWNKAITKFGAKNLTALEKPVYGLIAFIVVGDIATSIVRGFEISTVTLVAVQIFYAIVFILIIVYIGYTSFLLFKYLRKYFTSDTSSRSKAYKKAVQMTKLVIALAAIIFMVLIASNIVLLPYFRYAKTELGIWGVVYILLAIKSGIKVSILAPSKKSLKHGPGYKSQATNSTNSTRSKSLNSMKDEKK